MSPGVIAFKAARLRAILLLLPAIASLAQSGSGANSVTTGSLIATLQLRDHHLASFTVTSPATREILTVDVPFVLELQNHHSLSASSLTLLHPPRLSAIAPQPSASRRAETLHGQQLCADLALPDSAGSATWCLIARTGTNYIRQQLTIHAAGSPLPLSRVLLLHLHAPHAATVGSVAGSPVVAANFFLGFEHPLASNTVTGDLVEGSIRRVLPLAANQSVTYSAVIGLARPGQMRRDFLSYIEDERAHPFRPFLHYNTWYDLGFGNRYDEAGLLNRIHAFGDQLVRKRGVQLDSFLLDDGWDNTSSLWRLNSGFSSGLGRSAAVARSYGAGIGMWLSPWGGYSREQQQRIAFGTAHGYEIVRGGYALSGPRYYAAFAQTCLDLMRDFHVNQFKFDGTGNANNVFPGSAFDSDFSAAIHLIDTLRQHDPSLFINLTTGTSPSPFWLRYADSIWRGGDDHSFAGVGPDRQRWITYRDAQTFRGVVHRGPLMPLNSLMLHGIIYAQYANGLRSDPTHAFADEVHSYFGSGTDLQELYITPSLLTVQDWDTLAASARWSRSNAATLKDTHWIGGDPSRLQVYGWAAWSPRKAILTLRNPSDQPGEITLDPATAFELPSEAARSYTMSTVWGSTEHAPFSLIAGRSHTFHLAPFQVLTLEGTPQPAR